MALPIEEFNPEEIKQEIAATGLFKTKTEYILIGDEPRNSIGVVSLKALLPADDYDGIKKFLQFTPRSILRDWFLKTVWPSLPNDFLWAFANNQGQYYDPTYGDYRQKKTFEDLVWAAFIDLFNEANLEYVNQQQIEPWTWEQQKLEAFYISQNKASLDALKQDIDSYREVTLAQDPEAQKIMEAYIQLPKLGDEGLEINRQNAIRELLKRKEYLTAQALIDAYRYASETVIADALVQPIPFDIVAEDGSRIVRKT